MSEEYKKGWEEGMAFAKEKRFWDRKIGGYNIGGCETWPESFKGFRNGLYSCGFAEGVQTGLNSK